jgi:O-methyltransferase
VSINNTLYKMVSKHYLNMSMRRFCEGTMPKRIFWWFCRLTNPHVPDKDSYYPSFRPFDVDKTFKALHTEISSRTLVSVDPLWVLYTLARQSLSLPGVYLEAGVYKGGTAKMLKEILRAKDSSKSLHLFDTFEGMPETDGKADIHKKGDFHDTSLEAVSTWVGKDNVLYHQGLLPGTFVSITSEAIAFAHVDVDIKSSVGACCDFIYPRLVPGGAMVFDDYGHVTCPGARSAVDEFFADKPEIPLVFAHGQAIVIKLPAKAD